MTITRLYTLGFESNGSSPSTELPGTLFGTDSAVSNALPKTGTYAMRVGFAQNSYTSLPIPPTRQLRMGWWMKSAGGSTGNYLLSLYTGSTRQVDLRITPTQKLSLGVATVVQASTANNHLPDAGYRHYSLDVKIHATAGWANLYCDGALLLSFTGNTGDADLITLIIGNNSTTNLSNYTYYDDIYLDDTTSEAAPVRAPAYQFLAIIANGNGATSGFTGSDGNSTDNYALVDDAPHNSDTDFVLAAAADLKDTYAMTTVSPPTSTAFSAVIPFAFARKPGIEDIQLKTVVRSGAAEVLSTAKALTTAYARLDGERVTLDPNTGLAWAQTGIDALEAGVQSAGTFA